MVFAEAGLTNGEHAAHERLSLGEAVRRCQQESEVVQADGDALVVFAETGLTNGDCAAQQWLGLGEAVGVLQQFRKAVEVDGEGWMLLAEAGLIYGKRAAHEGLCLGEAISGCQHKREVIEACGNIEIVLPEFTLVYFCHRPQERLGFGVSGEITERSRGPNLVVCPRERIFDAVGEGCRSGVVTEGRFEVLLVGRLVEKRAGGVAHRAQGGNAAVHQALFAGVENRLVFAHHEEGAQFPIKRGVQGGGESRGFGVEDARDRGCVHFQQTREFRAHHLVDGGVRQFFALLAEVAEALLIESEGAIRQAVELEVGGELPLRDRDVLGSLRKVVNAPANTAESNENGTGSEEGAAVAAVFGVAEGVDGFLQGEDARFEIGVAAGLLEKVCAVEQLCAVLALQAGFFLGLGLGVGFVREVLGADEGIDTESLGAALLLELSGDVIFDLGVAAARRAGRETGGVGLGAVAQTGDVNEGLAVADLAVEHVGDRARVGLEIGLLDWVAIDREQGVFDDLPDSAQVAAGGGDEDLRRARRIHAARMGLSRVK